MRRQFKYFAAAASLLTLMTACTADKLEAYYGQPNPNPETPDNAISFGTYMGKTGTTRADVGGGTDAIDLDKLKAEGYGFGVFAFYTGTKNYGGTGDSDKGYRDADGGNFPNFMYNEKVYWSSDNWKYDNTKYWPNEFSSTGKAVDDQNNDTGNDPATTENANGGNVTFFAYAPYVAVKEQSDDDGIAGATTISSGDTQADEGIIGISGNGWVGATATSEVGARVGDPYITYQLPSGNKTVDLLWGTAGANSVKATGEAQSGQTTGLNENSYEGIDGTTKKDLPYTTTYENDILKGYKVNDNLNKQKTQGKVEFVFKHALAKIGGSYVGESGVGDDEDAKTSTNGLMVILDLDKDGAESGGSLQKYTGSSSDVTGTPYNTKVTINELVISTGKQLKSGVDPSDPSFTYDETTYEKVISKGKLNLATGRWGDMENTNDLTKTQTIKPASAYPATSFTDADKAEDAILSEELREPVLSGGKLSGKDPNTKEFFEALPIGVTTVAKNVYETETQPLVFIPGTRPVLEFTITYTVRTFDNNLKNKYTEVKQEIKKRLYLAKEIELNKQYNILMHLGLTGVKFTASVSDWDATSVSGSTTNPGDGNSPVTVFDDEVEHVWLPSNVSEETTKGTVTSGGTASVNTAATTTSYALTIDGITATSDKLTFEKVGAGITAAPAETSLSSVTSKAVSVTLTANKTNKPVVNVLKIKEMKGTTVVKTSTVTIVQNPDQTYTLSEATALDAAASSTTTFAIAKAADSSKPSSVTVTVESPSDSGVNPIYSDGTVTLTVATAYTDTANDRTLKIKLEIDGYTYYKDVKQNKATE